MSQGAIWGSGAAEETRRRLLDAAEELFAAKGLAGASIREITAAAGCNVAAVNYHFNSKLALYEEVFRRRLGELRQQRIEAVAQVLEDAIAQQRIEPVLLAFARAFLRPLMDPALGRRMLLLFMREMLDPHVPRSLFMEQMIGPIQAALTQAMCRIMPTLDPGDARMCLHSLVAQLIHVVQAPRMIDASSQPDDPMLQAERAIEHIVRFTAAGIRGLAAAGQAQEGQR